MSASAESFVDELVTWRELGFIYCARHPDFDRYETLPEWALETLETHAADTREHVYTLDEFAAAATHDEIWNAAQRQLVAEGVIHNYLRMLWGKKILEWTRHPREAFDVMIELNNRYAIDGRDPQLVHRDRVGAGKIRPRLAGACDLREGAVDELRFDPQEGTPGRVPLTLG